MNGDNIGSRMGSPSPAKPVVYLDKRDTGTEIDQSTDTSTQNFRFEIAPDHHYVFSVGVVGKGKSTFQSHLLRYLSISREFDARPDPLIITPTSEAQKILTRWQKEWAENKLPIRTALNEYAQFQYTITPKGRRRATPLKFGFCEMAGERFTPIVAEYPVSDPLPEGMSEFLLAQDMRSIFILVTRGATVGTGSTPAHDDALFNLFLNHLRATFPGIEMRSSILVLLSDPASCREALKAQSGGALEQQLNVDKYLDAFLSTTRGLLETSWNNHWGVAEFYVGRVNTQSKTIARPSFIHAEDVFDWCYSECTGKSIRRRGPPWYQRLFLAAAGKRDERGR